MTINRLNQGTTNQVLVKAISGQTTNLLELQDSSGNVVSSIGPTGAQGGTFADRGLVHINTTSFTGVAAISVPNDTFTSAYKNYRVLVQLGSSAGSGTLNLRLRKSGTDSSTGYFFGGWAVNSGATTAAQVGNGAGNFTLIRLSNDADNRFSSSIDIYNPKENVKTAFNSIGSGNDAAPEVHIRGGFHNVADTYDSISLLHSGGNNIAGTIQVFGYKD